MYFTGRERIFLFYFLSCFRFSPTGRIRGNKAESLQSFTDTEKQLVLLSSLTRKLVPYSIDSDH